MRCLQVQMHFTDHFKLQVIYLRYVTQLQLFISVSLM